MKLTSSTTANAITQLLSATKGHGDGISVGGLSFRLSNVPKNIENLAAQVTKLNGKTIATLVLLISAGVLACSDSAETIYISDKEQKNDYLINKMNTRVDLSEIIAGVCETIPTVNKDNQYVAIKSWNWNPWAFYDLVLSRGKGQLGNTIVEECLQRKIQEQINYPTCEKKDISVTNVVIGFTVAVAVSLAVIGIVWGIVAAVVHCSDRKSKKNLNPEEGEKLHLLTSTKQTDVTKKTTYDSLTTNQLTTFKPTLPESESVTYQEKNCKWDVENRIKNRSP